MSLRLTRRTAALSLLAALAAGPALGDDAGPSGPIKALNDALLRAMRAGGKAPFANRVAMVQPAIEAAFDLQQILRSSVGPHWAALTAAQQADLSGTFVRYTVDSYVANFDGFSGERFDILPELRDVGADRVVQTRIVPPQGDAARIDYQMRPTPAGWKAVDVLLDGSISRVAIQRSDFRALLAKGDPAPLLASLRKKIAGLESGGKP